MSRLAWDKWFWNDWEGDTNLKMCSLAAQGLWMRLLCIAAKAKPKGYILVKDKTPTLDDLALQIGRPASEIAPLMEELSGWGVFSRDRKGRMYSRKMVRNEKKRAQAQKHGRLGGNPSLCKKGDNPSPDKGSDKPPDKPQESEARDQKIFSKEKIRARMDEIWAVYPHPTNRGAKPYAKFARLSAEEVEGFAASIPILKDGLRADHKRGFDRQAPMFQTFLNQRRWEGLLEASSEAPEKPPEPMPDDPQAAKFAAALRDRLRPGQYASWFVEDGKPLIRRIGNILYVGPCAQTRRDAIDNRFKPACDEVAARIDLKFSVDIPQEVEWAA